MAFIHQPNIEAKGIADLSVEKSDCIRSSSRQNLDGEGVVAIFTLLARIE